MARAIAGVALAQRVRTDADEGAAFHRGALDAVEVAPEGEDDGEVDQEGDQQREAALYPRVAYRGVHLVRDRARVRARARVREAALYPRVAYGGVHLLVSL